MQPNHFNSSNLSYRPDIDGLRALAVLSVVVYHAFPEWMSGGFIGVDVFFVISGYLITKIIFNNLDVGTFNFHGFYARRIKRIFPALLLVLVTSYVFGWFALLSDEYKQLGKHIVTGAGFVSNIALWNESGYFDNLADTKPLLHLWSLGIEEQFYLFWPLMIWALYKLRLNASVVLLFVTLASLCLNVILIGKDPIGTFFLPQTRFWELSFGALLASQRQNSNQKLAFILNCYGNKPLWGSLHKKYKINERYIRNISSFIGLSILGYGFWRVNKNFAYPGVWAIIPVAGTLLLIMAGPSAWINAKLLGSRAAVLIGLISFPLYLWHWPLLSFARIVESESLSTGIRLAIVILSIILAWTTYRFIERPLRNGRSNTKIATWLCILMLIAGYIGFNTYAREGYEFRGTVSALKNNKNELTRTPPQDLECLEYVGKKTPLFPYCRYNNVGGKETVAVVGDSHAHVGYSGISEYLQNRGVNTILLANSSCPPLLDVPIIVGRNENEKQACQNRIVELIEILLSHDEIKKIIFLARGPIYFTGVEPLSGSIDVMQGGSVTISDYQKGTQKTIDKLVKAGKVVYYITENPELELMPEACMARPLRFHVKDCSIDKALVRFRQESYLNVARSFSGITLIENMGVFCPADRCLAFDPSGALLYADDDHLSIAGSKFQVENIGAGFLD